MSRKGSGIVVVGGAYVDMTLRCPEFPSAGQAMTGSGLNYSPSGPGINQAVQAVLCGCAVHLVTKVGGDPFGEMLRSSLEEWGVHTDYVQVAQALNTGVVVTLVNAAGENAACRCPGANAALQARDVEVAEQAISEASVCLIHGQLPQEAIVEAICLAQVHGTRVIVNPAPQCGPHSPPAGDLPIECFSADLLLANLLEAAEIAEGPFGGQTHIHAAKMIGSELVARGVRHAVVTLGRRGCVLVDRNGAEHIPTFEVELVHQTGRGDAFAGALAAYLAVEDDLKKAVEFASAAGALACTKFGFLEAMPTKAEIIQLLQQRA
ncbi:MAG: ribokinase [Phycisphaerae bacterium]|nr:ribokinase [Phycisphaerae bacterium]